MSNGAHVPFEHDILTSIAHPVPVAGRSRRSHAVSLGFARARTPATIRYVSPREMTQVAVRYADGSGSLNHAMFEGRIWGPCPILDYRPPGLAALEASGLDWLTELPLPSFRNIFDSHAARLYGTVTLMGQPPLTIRRSEHLYQHDIPMTPAHEATEDLTDLCRSLVAEKAARDLVHDGECLFVALPNLLLDADASRGISGATSVHPCAPRFPHDEVDACIDWFAPLPPSRAPDVKTLRRAAREIAAVHGKPLPLQDVEEYANAAAVYVAEAAGGATRVPGQAGHESRRRLMEFWPLVARASVDGLRGTDLIPALEGIRGFAEHLAESHLNATRRDHMAEVVRVVTERMIPRAAAHAHSLIAREDIEAMGQLAP